MRKWSPIVVALMAALAVSTHCTPAAQARPTWEPPSNRQLLRLYQLDPYIRYFTARTYGPRDTTVPADYIRALILTESGGNWLAQSGKGARGLTQIMPATAREALRELASHGDEYAFVDDTLLEDFSDEDLYDPAINILIACHITAKYRARYKESTELVVSAWNAGPTAVARHGYRPPPYIETLTSIARVENYMRFFAGTAVY